MARAAEKAVERLVSGVVAEAGSDFQKRRHVLKEYLARLQVSPKEARAWRDGLDIVGAAYERLFTGEERRDKGQFFTPFWAGEVIARWVFDREIDLALDPGCGSGGLLNTRGALSESSRSPPDWYRRRSAGGFNARGEHSSPQAGFD